jgi:hypothetical protein
MPSRKNALPFKLIPVFAVLALATRRARPQREPYHAAQGRGH